MDRIVYNEVSKNIFDINSIEKNINGLLAAIKAINDKIDESKLTGEPIYKPRTYIIEDDDTPVMLYKGSDVYELDYSIFLMKRLILDYITAVEELKERNFHLTGKTNDELINDKEFVGDVDVFKEKAFRELELDKNLDKIKQRFQIEVTDGNVFFEKYEKEMDESHEIVKFEIKDQGIEEGKRKLG